MNPENSDAKASPPDGPKTEIPKSYDPKKAVCQNCGGPIFLLGDAWSHRRELPRCRRLKPPVELCLHKNVTKVENGCFCNSCGAEMEIPEPGVVPFWRPKAAPEKPEPAWWPDPTGIPHPANAEALQLLFNDAKALARRIGPKDTRCPECGKNCEEDGSHASGIFECTRCLRAFNAPKLWENQVAQEPEIAKSGDLSNSSISTAESMDAFNKATGYDPSILHNPDAKVWADYFLRCLSETVRLKMEKDRGGVSTEKLTQIVMTPGYMEGWFSNAMMAMHDVMEARRKKERIDDVADGVFMKVVIFVLAGAGLFAVAYQVIAHLFRP